MATYSWSPFREFEALRRELDRALSGQENAGSPITRSSFLPGRAARAYPLVNVSEDKENLYIQALAPGVDPASFDVSVVRNHLSISGQKNPAGDGANADSFHRNERAAGRFVRTIDLPVEVEDKNVQAEYKNGLLTVTLPKAEAAKPKQVSIKVG